MVIGFEFYLYALFALIFIAAIVSKFFFSRGAIIRRKLRKTIVRKISSFQDGEIAKTIGAVKYVGPPLVAPLSGKQCAYYHFLLEGKRGKSWYTIIEEEIAGNLVIKDGSDYALIETGKVKSYLVADKQYRTGFLEDETDPLRVYLLKHGYDSKGLLEMNNSLRYEEGILEEGEIIAVSGKGIWKRKSEIKLKIPVEKILMIGPGELTPVYFSNDLKAVKSNETQK